MSFSASEDGTYFATVAESYDRLQPVLSPPYSKGLDMLVDLIPFDPEDMFAFAELGCGTAEPTLHVLEHFPHATGTCVDSEFEMLALARRKLRSHPGRAELVEGDMVRCDIRACDVIFSAKAIHHVPPPVLPELFARIMSKLRPKGCFILFDAMSVGPDWGERIRRQAARSRGRHRQRAIASGIATQQEIQARREYKRKMKEAGKDVEYDHTAEDVVSILADAGFDEVAVVWRMYADTILMAFKE